LNTLENGQATSPETQEDMLLKELMEFGFETDLWTTERVASVIEQKFGIKYHTDHVRRILRNSLKFYPSEA
jgi:transposase